MVQSFIDELLFTKLATQNYLERDSWNEIFVISYMFKCLHLTLFFNTSCGFSCVGFHISVAPSGVPDPAAPYFQFNIFFSIYLYFLHCSMVKWMFSWPISFIPIRYCYRILTGVFFNNKQITFSFFSEPRVNATVDENLKEIQGRPLQVIWDLVQSILMGK